MAQPLLEVKHLKTQFRTKRGTVTAVDDVSFSVNQGDTLGIVGESGCGKSVTSLSILQLLPHAVGSVAGGEILYKGEDIAKKGNKEMCRIRGREISMIFQDSMTSLNPVLTIGRQLEETISVHSSLSKDEIKKQALDILTKVGVSSPEQRLKEFPHQLSGGMRQRVMIAMALSCSPSLLIADEPTTALDVTIQAQIIDLMVELKKNINASIILITHDMGVVAEMADYIMVMYAGKVMEYGSARYSRRPCILIHRAFWPLSPALTRIWTACFPLTVRCRPWTGCQRDAGSAPGASRLWTNAGSTSRRCISRMTATR